MKRKEHSSEREPKKQKEETNINILLDDIWFVIFSFVLENLYSVYHTSKAFKRLVEGFINQQLLTEPWKETISGITTNELKKKRLYQFFYSMYLSSSKTLGAYPLSHRWVDWSNSWFPLIFTTKDRGWVMPIHPKNFRLFIIAGGQGRIISFSARMTTIKEILNRAKGLEGFVYPFTQEQKLSAWTMLTLYECSIIHSKTKDLSIESFNNIKL